MKKSLYQITEYQSFAVASEEECKKYNGIKSMNDPATFNALKDFVLSNKNQGDNLDLMVLSAKKGLGEVITAKNYVGLITLRDGTNIEILPKISRDLGDSDDDIRKVKDIFLQMLKTLPNFSNKSVQTTNVDTSKMNIFEIFVRMFIDEILGIAKRGIKSDYVSTQENLTCFKGKMLIAENIRYNFAHAEHVFVEYDEFSVNRSENKLIKATLQLLAKKSSNLNNKKDLRLLLTLFDGISSSDNYENDFSKCKIDRNMSDYYRALIWCKIFLKGKSFTSYSGSTISMALLFPMNDIFESFIANKVKSYFKGTDYQVSIQDKIYYLYSSPKAFRLKPDIVIRNRNDSSDTYIIDTKWKLLFKGAHHYDISRDDIYQMFAYQRKYHAKDVTLIYPQVSDLSNIDNIKYEDADENDIIRVQFVNLKDKESINNTLPECLSNIISP